MLDDVHGGHGKPGPVHHAGDVPFESDVVEVELGGLHLAGVFLRFVSEFDYVGMAKEGVGIEVHLSVESDDVPVRGGNEGVDLDNHDFAYELLSYHETVTLP